MVRCGVIALCLAVYSVLTPASRGEEPPAKAKVEFRWLENKYVKGLTEERGVQITCGPQRAYPHNKAVLTSKDVASTRLSKCDFSSNGLPSELYMVSFTLTEQAKKTLLADWGDVEVKMLTVMVDGQPSCIRYVRKADVADLAPQAGFMSSRYEAERIMAACK